jgi:deazaflavin-dependent oxidoreductase (nitroreductase family)
MTDFEDIAAVNRQVIEQFRSSGGRGEFGPIHFDRLVLLTTTGRKSGRKRTVPLGHERDGDSNLVLFASNMGAAQDPQWYRNIVADPRVTAEVTGKSS